MNLVMLMMEAGTLGGITSGLARTNDSAPAPGNPASPAASGPKIQFAGTVFDFGKVTSGEAVRHDFVFTNIGTDTLEIKEVRPGCGCTTAGNWDKRVEPGKTGAIPLQFNSAGFGGTVTKSADYGASNPTATFHCPRADSEWVVSGSGRV